MNYDSAKFQVQNASQFLYKSHTFHYSFNTAGAKTEKPLNNRSFMTAVTSFLTLPYQLIKDQKEFHFKLTYFCTIAAVRRS